MILLSAAYRRHQMPNRACCAPRDTMQTKVERIAFRLMPTNVKPRVNRSVLVSAVKDTPGPVTFLKMRVAASNIFVKMLEPRLPAGRIRRVCRVRVAPPRVAPARQTEPVWNAQPARFTVARPNPAWLPMRTARLNCNTGAGKQKTAPLASSVGRFCRQQNTRFVLRPGGRRI